MEDIEVNLYVNNCTVKISVVRHYGDFLALIIYYISTNMYLFMTKILKYILKGKRDLCKLISICTE